MTVDERRELEEEWSELRALQDRAERLAGGPLRFSEAAAIELDEVAAELEMWEQALASGVAA